jgi:hypothetical protein
MPLRALNLALTTLTLLAIGVPILGQPSAPTTTLRIASLGRDPIHVRVTLKALRRASDSVLEPPASIDIADSIRTVHLTVIGFGFIHAELREAPATDRSPVVGEGRDLTFARGDTGHFQRVWTVQPLVP